MTIRRQFLKQGASVVVSGLLGSIPAPTIAQGLAGNKMCRMPDEGDQHAATWMAFGADARIWGRRLLPAVQENLAAIAKAISRFEPVNMLVREGEHDRAAELCGPSVNLIVQPVDDLWMRDTGPVFVKNAAGALGGVDFNFNGWGGKQKHAQDRKVAGFISARAEATPVETTLVLEGGGIEVDGEGTAIITESCVLNPNRNPGLGKSDCEAELSRLLGIEKVIWLPGIAGMDITDGHTDFYARFATDGVVFAGLENDPDSFDYDVTRQHLEILRSARNAKGRRLEVVTLPGPETIRDDFASRDFAAGYINFYVCNGAVIAPEFGSPSSDSKTRQILTDLFPGREIIQLNIDAIAAGGGGIHCTTQQQPK